MDRRSHPRRRSLRIRQVDPCMDKSDRTHETKWRDITMKKTRMLMCLLLVAVLVTSMASPAMAESANGSGVQNGCSYTWTITRGESTGVAAIKTPGAPGSLTAQVCNQLYYDLTGNRIETKEVVSTGYASASASDDNIMTINGVRVRAEITCTIGGFSLNGYIITSAYNVGTYREGLEKEAST